MLECCSADASPVAPHPALTPDQPCPALSSSDLSRTLSYEGAEFALCHLEVDPVFK